MTAQEAQTCWLRGENGVVFEHRLPLPEPIAERVLKGYIVRVANAAGDPYDDTAPEPAAAPASEPPSPLIPLQSGPDSGTSPDTPEPAGQGPGPSDDIRSTPDPSEAPAPLEQPPAQARPTRKDRKAVWVGYVVRNVVKADGSRWTAEDADGRSVAELAEEIERWATANAITFAEA